MNIKTFSIIGIFIFVLAFLNRQALAQVLTGDVNKDGQVNVVDYQLVQSVFGTSAAAADFNLNGIVDLFDINAVIANIYAKQNTTNPTPTTIAGNPTSTPRSPTATTRPTSGVTSVPPTSTPIPPSGASPTTAPPNTGNNQIGDLQLHYQKGGIWLTDDEIRAIPTNNDGWTAMVNRARDPMNIVSDLPCTAGGGCADARSPINMLARAIVGTKFQLDGNPEGGKMITELKNELDKMQTAIDATLTRSGDIPQDEKWAERNIGPIATAANIIDYRTDALKKALRGVIYERKFDGNAYTIQFAGLHWLPNKPSWGRWSTLATAYLLEDWDTVNAAVKAEAKMLGEPLWNGRPNDAPIEYMGDGKSVDKWHTLEPVGGRVLLIMPAGATYDYGGKTRYIGGLYIGDTWRSAPSTTWPPAKTTDSNYIWEGAASNNTIVWAAHHLGYKDAFKWGDYAMLRTAIFNYSTHDGKPAITAESTGDQWQNAAIMAWATSEIGPVLPDRLKPDPTYPAVWPLPVKANTEPGRGMGFMYATHYARLVK
ncbi:MAG: dockerin type I repeat-containing protein [Patescibacteria group bacterium]